MWADSGLGSCQVGDAGRSFRGPRLIEWAGSVQGFSPADSSWDCHVCGSSLLGCHRARWAGSGDATPRTWSGPGEVAAIRGLWRPAPSALTTSPDRPSARGRFHTRREIGAHGLRRPHRQPARDPRTAIAGWIAAGPFAAYGCVFLIVFIETGVVFFPFLPETPALCLGVLRAGRRVQHLPPCSASPGRPRSSATSATS